MIYVTHVESNIKGGVKVDLKPVSLIIGPNDSGKSAIIQAIQLALTGSIDDLAGKNIVRTEKALLCLAPRGAKTLFARVTLSDGSVASWEADIEKDKIKKPIHQVPPGVIPSQVFAVRNTIEALSGTAKDTIRKWFLTQAEVNESLLFELIPVTHQQAFADVYKNTDQLLPVAMRVEETYELLRSRSMKVAREITASKKVLEELANKFVGEAPQGTIEELNAKANKVQAKLLSIARDLEFWNAPPPEVFDVHALSARKVQLIQQQTVLVEALRKIQDKVPEKVKALIPALRWMMNNKQLSPCIICKTHGVEQDIQERYETVVNAVETVKKQTADLSTKLREVEAHLGDVNYQLDLAERQKSHFQLKPAKTKEELLADKDKLETLLVSLRSDIGKLHEFKRQKEILKEANEVVQDKKLEHRLLQEMIDIVKNNIDILLRQSMEDFVKRVDAALPKKMKFLFDAESNTFGLKIGDQTFDASSLAMARYVQLTMAIAAASRKSAENGLHILVPDDRAFDVSTLLNMIDTADALSDKMQTIIATVQPAHFVYKPEANHAFVTLSPK